MKHHRLPTFGFTWLSVGEIERFDLMSIAPDSDHGYIIECDLDYPEELHDAHDSFPRARTRSNKARRLIGLYQKACGTVRNRHGQFERISKIMSDTERQKALCDAILEPPVLCKTRHETKNNTQSDTIYAESMA